MRMRRYLLAECLVLALAVAGAGLLVRGVVRRAFAQREVPTARTPAQGSLAAELDPPFPPSPNVVQESAGTFMGLEDDALIARLRSQPIVRMRFNKIGRAHV